MFKNPRRLATLGMAILAFAACEDDNLTNPDAIVSGTDTQKGRGAPGAVFTMTNEAAGNQVVAFARNGDGTLSESGRFATGGTGLGEVRLGSQGPVTLTEDHRFLLVVNIGSNDVSVFRVRPGARLELVDREDSRGEDPYSVTVRKGLVYVLNNGGDGNIAGFRLSPQGDLTFLEGSIRPMSQAGGTNPGQVLFSPDGRSLVVTEKGTDILDTYTVDKNGYADGPIVNVSSGDTPFGGAFTRDGVYIVTEAHDALPGQAAASSYRTAADGSLEVISGTVQNGQTDVCWTVITKDGDFAYITNFGSGTISGYRIGADGSITLNDAVAARTAEAQGPRDLDISQNGRFLYALEIGFEDDPSLPDDPTGIFGYRVQKDGTLEQIAVFAEGDLPDTVAGLDAF